MLKYTGHPLVDVGVATITAFAGKDDPSDVTEQNLAEIANYMEHQYGKNPMKSFLTVIFPNSGFTQYAFDKQPEKRAAYANEVLRGWQRTTASEDRCVFFGTPALARVYREAIPLIGAASGFNFYAEGDSGLPISGEALLSIQAFPLGGLKCSGRVLILHADNPKLTLTFASQALTANRRYLSLAAQAEKYSDTKYPRTQIIERLVAAEQARRDHDLCSVTAYHLTNYGTNADVTIYHVPLQIMAFLRAATDAAYKTAWQRLVGRGWAGGDGTNDDAPSRDELGFSARSNVLYEDLFALPTEAGRFLRTYLLRIPQLERTNKDDQRRTYRLDQELDLVSWPLAQLFLKEVMNVDEDRIEAIRMVADRIADYIRQEEESDLIKTFLWGENNHRGFQRLRDRLTRANYASAKSKGPLFSLDEFIAVFANSNDRFSWMLSRDLVLIRMIERLHATGWIGAHPEVVAPPRKDDADDSQE